jgi:tRNA uridine 5-carboxymethylaminomethyl modification enzyme
LTLTPFEAAKHGIHINGDGQRRNLSQLLSYDNCNRESMGQIWPEILSWPDNLFEQIEIDALYSGYMSRQKAEIESFRRDENMIIDNDIDYDLIPGLSNEAKERLKRTRPHTLGQAGRIEGLTAGALSALLFYIKAKQKRVG